MRDRFKECIKIIARKLVDNKCMRCHKHITPSKPDHNRWNTAWKAAPQRNLHVHRIIKGKNGGKYLFDNIRVLCYKCHALEDSRKTVKGKDITLDIFLLKKYPDLTERILFVTSALQKAALDMTIDVFDIKSWLCNSITKK